jgi:hypothetical protein
MERQRRAFRVSALTRPSGRGPRATLSRWAGEGIEAPIKPVGELRTAVRTTREERPFIIDAVDGDQD